MKKDEDIVTAYVKRHGVQVLKVQARITGDVPPDAKEFFPEIEKNKATLGAEFHLKYNRECFGTTRNPIDGRG